MTNAIHRRILAFVLAIATVIAFTPAIAFTQSASAATRPGKVKWSSITKTPTTITLKWKKASKAKGYAVYQKKSGKYKKIKTTTKRTYTVKKLKAFKSYSFKVRAYRMSGGKKVYGKYSSVKKVTTAASKITGVTITSSASSISAGSNVTFTATVTGGTKPLKYQWYKDGVLIEGATDSTYTAALSSSDSGAKFTCKVTGPDGKSLTSEEAGSVTVYNTVTRTVVKSWNIGSDTAGNNYTGLNGTDKVVATLYSDGELAVTGSGDTVVFDNPGNAGGTPWAAATYKTQVKSSTIESTVGTTNMEHWYEGCAITAAPAIPSSVESMADTFHGCTALKAAPAIPNGVTSITYTFYGCTALTTAPTIPSSVTGMGYTFYGCTALKAAPTIPSSVTGMGYTFYGCTALTTAPTIPSSMNYMDSTFENCTALTTAPDISRCTKLTNMTYTFNGCTALTTAPTIPGSVLTMSGTFSGCTALTGTMLIKADINNPFDYTDCFNGAATNTGTDLKVTCMKSNLTAVTGIVGTKSANSNIALGNPTWNIGAATSGVNYTGSNGTATVVATLYSDGELAVTGSGDTVVFYSPLAPWCKDTYKEQVKSSTIASTVKPTNMGFWYIGCSNLTEAPSIPASVKNMQATFSGCNSLTNAPDLTGCTNLKNMGATFSGCRSLTDMSSYVIPASVTDMAETFNNCTKLTNAPAIPSGVNDMSYTFASCTALATGPSVIPASVTLMGETFYNCNALTGIMQINASPSYYEQCFEDASTNAGTNLTVYGSKAANNEAAVNNIVNTKSGTSTINYNGLK